MDKHRLKNSSIYLCGQLESDPNAALWRIDLANDLAKIEPTLKVWDPIIKPEWVPLEVRDNTIALENKKYIFNPNSLGMSQDDAGFQCFEANKYIRSMCKMLANKTDILVARISKTFTWGSIDELEIAINRKIPIFLWLPDGPISVYGIAGCVNNYDLRDYYIHFNKDSLLNTLRQINDGLINLPEMDPETWLYLKWYNVIGDKNDKD